MNAEQFADAFKKHKNCMVREYLWSKETKASELIADLKLDNNKIPIIEKLIDVLLTDAFYTILLGLDGAANIGGVQQQYKIYDEDGNLISDCGNLEAAAYEVFHDNKQMDK